MPLSRIVPPMTRRWYEVLPKPYNVELPIIAVAVPGDWSFHEGTTKDKTHAVLAAVSPDESKVLGLQVVDVDCPKYMDQREVFDENGVRMADPEYIGPISGLPQSLLMNEDVTVILFSRDEMWKAPVNMKRVFKRLPPEKRC